MSNLLSRAWNTEQTGTVVGKLFEKTVPMESNPDEEESRVSLGSTNKSTYLFVNPQFLQ